MGQILGAVNEDVYEYLEMTASTKMPYFWLANRNSGFFQIKCKLFS
jgi:hypothetical protein